MKKETNWPEPARAPTEAMDTGHTLFPAPAKNSGSVFQVCQQVFFRVQRITHQAD